MVPAAGRGERLGPGDPKALRFIAGTPLLVHAIRHLAACPDIEVIVVAAPVDQVVEVGELLAEEAPDAELTVVAGGSTRQESVGRALESLPPDVDFVLVHDAARAFVPVGVIDRVIAALRDGALAVVPVVPVTDTIKLVDSDECVVGTPSRDALRAVQTPQGFRIDILESAHAMADGAATDDASLAERAGIRVDTVAGDVAAFKVTRPFDLLVAEALIAAADKGLSQ